MDITECMTELSDYGCEGNSGRPSNEDVISGFRLYNRNGFCLTSVCASVLREQHLATRSLRVRQL
jgi:hypothetical protein